jgi:hypothetical protein
MHVQEMNILIDCSRMKQKLAFQETRRKQLQLFRLKWNTDWQLLQPITNQQPKDYKEPINKSEDKVRSFNNTVNKYMSSKLEDKVINGKNLLTLPSTKNFIT